MTAIDTIKAYCAHHKIRLTPIRLHIIHCLSEQSTPISAYELLDRLKIDNENMNIMSVYRSLDFLKSHGVIHKINTNNTYSLCCHPSDALCQVFICQKCNQSFEVHSIDITNQLNALAAKSGFEIKQNKIELFGLCQSCRATT